MTHIHDVVDTDIHYKIDGVSRTITNINEVKKTLVQHDHNSEVLTFEIPRYIDGHDLTKCNSVGIHYINIETTGKEKYEDVYGVKDLGVKKDDEQIAIFTWTVSELSTQYAGTLNFTIRFACVNEEGKATYAWHTLIFRSIYISDGIFNSEVVVGNHSDILDQWYSRLFTENDEAVNNIITAKNAALTEIENKEISAVKVVDDKEKAAISEVNATKEEAINKIITKGREVLDTIPDDYATLDAKVEQSIAISDKTRIVSNTNGSLHVLSDSAEAPLQGMRIYGKTTQFTTTGKNLLPYPYGETTVTRNGITFTDNGDGSITINGTATVDSYFYFLGANKNIKFEPGNYTLTGCPQDGRASTYYLYAYDSTTSTVYRDEGSGVSFAATGDHEYRFFIVIRNGIAASNLTFKPMLRFTSITDDTYEPYTGGMPSPNPNYPQELVSVGDSGSVEQVICGKNLFRYSYDEGYTFTKNGITFTFSNDGLVLVTGTATARTFYEVIPPKQPMLLPKGTYMLTGCPLGGADNKYMITLGYYYVGNEATSRKIHKDFGSGKIVSFEKDVYIDLLLGVDINQTPSNLTFKPMLRLASITDDTWEPPNHQSLTIPTPNGLPGVPVSSGGNYTDENGQQYVSDYKDYERMVYVQRVGVWKYTGGDVTINTCMIYNNHDVIYWNINIPGVKAHMNQFEVMSNVFLRGKFAYRSSGYISTDTYNNYLYMSLKASDFGFVYGDGRDSEYRPAIKNWMQTTFSEENPLIAYYELLEPIETPLSEEEIAAYKALHTNKPYTTIYNSDGAHTEVEYCADPKLYIDNKFAELQANILNTIG